MAYDKGEALKLDNQLCFPLYAAARRITGKYSSYLKPLGITYTQYIVLLVLWENDGLTVGEIGARLMLDNGTLTPLLKKMEAAGYVNRIRSKQDERVVQVHLTDSGRKLREKALEIPMKMRQCVALAPGEAELLRKILDKLISD